MHEAAVAENLVGSILAEAEKNSGKVVRVAISCGQISAVNDEAMQFAFEAATEGTVCQGAKLCIKHIPLKCVCKNCNKEFDFDFYDPFCPHCSKNNYSMGQDAPLLLEEIEFEQD